MHDFFFSSDAMMLNGLVDFRKKIKNPVGSDIDVAVNASDAKWVNECLKKEIRSYYPSRLADFLRKTKDQYQYESLYLFIEMQDKLDMRSFHHLGVKPLGELRDYFQQLSLERRASTFSEVDDALAFIKPVELIHLMVEYDAPFFHRKQEKVEDVLLPEETHCCRIL